MKGADGKKIVPGLYVKFNEKVSQDNTELYTLQEKEGQWIALDMDGNYFSIDDALFYDSRRNQVRWGVLDSSDLFLIDEKNYDTLKNTLLNSQKKISKLLQLLEDNKANLSAKTPEPIRVNKSNPIKPYPIRETQFTTNSRLNNESNLSEKGAKILQFKSKKQREAEERFYHLADHLFPSKTKEDPENSA